MNTNSFSNSYKEAGVDVTAGYKAVELMKQHVARTMTSGVLSGIGGFGGLFELDMTGITKPVLVSGTDSWYRLRGNVRKRHYLLRCKATVFP